MEVVKWRQLQEATADMAKALGLFRKELRTRGFSRRETFKLVNDFMLTMIGQERQE